MTDDIDRSVWANIMLGNQLKKLHDVMWEAVHNRQLVRVTVGGSTTEFIPHDDGMVLVLVDGHQVADVNINPARYP